jgi:FHA domain
VTSPLCRRCGGTLNDKGVCPACDASAQGAGKTIMVPVQPAPSALGPAAPASEALARVPLPEEWEIVLDLVAGPCPRQSFRVTRSCVLIGRGSVDIALEDPRVSRRHASLEVYGAALLLLKDLGSTNGTLVNGRRVSVCELADGDEIRVGDTTLVATIGVPPK